MKIRPAHHAILCYAEWCADNRRPWPGMKRVAADMARDLSDMRTAFTDLTRWGLLSVRHQGYGHRLIVRLGDGRETSPHARPSYTHDIPAIHRNGGRTACGTILPDDARIAA